MGQPDQCTDLLFVRMAKNRNFKVFEGNLGKQCHSGRHKLQNAENIFQK